MILQFYPLIEKDRKKHPVQKNLLCTHWLTDNYLLADLVQIKFNAEVAGAEIMMINY